MSPTSSNPPPPTLQFFIKEKNDGINTLKNHYLLIIEASRIRNNLHDLLMCNAVQYHTKTI